MEGIRSIADGDGGPANLVSVGRPEEFEKKRAREGSAHGRPSWPSVHDYLSIHPLLRLAERGIIPVLRGGTKISIVFGSIQDLTPMFGEKMYMLRWRYPDPDEL